MGTVTVAIVYDKNRQRKSGIVADNELAKWQLNYYFFSSAVNGTTLLDGKINRPFVMAYRRSDPFQCRMIQLEKVLKLACRLQLCYFIFRNWMLSNVTNSPIRKCQSNIPTKAFQNS